MGNFRGLANLKTPHDLVKKLEFDLDRLEAIDTQQNLLYAAFDFFVTAEHILDWKYPKNTSERERLRNSEILLQITSHLANGAKHFEATNRRHQSVDDVENNSYVDDGYVEPGYFETSIVVRLAGDSKTYFQTDTIDVVVLANRVRDFWKKNVTKL